MLSSLILLAFFRTLWFESRLALFFIFSGSLIKSGLPLFYCESPVSKQRRNGLLADRTVSALETLTCMSKKAGRPDCECRLDRMSAQHGAIRGLSWFVVSALAGTEVCAIRPASGRHACMGGHLPGNGQRTALM